MSIQPTDSQWGISDHIYNQDADYINSQTLKEEYENYLQDLHRKLQIAKEERKRSEMEATVLQHRVMLLLNQEKLAIRKFETTKNKLEDLYNKRRIISENQNYAKLHKSNRDKEIQNNKENTRIRRESLKSAKSLSSTNRNISCVNFSLLSRVILDRRKIKES
jgi:hypothetical protein